MSPISGYAVRATISSRRRRAATGGFMRLLTVSALTFECAARVFHCRNLLVQKYCGSWVA
jgi:hypothetical protein